ncbi:hypothetical protein ABI59_20780 [Acidobacteria bacterium Mor1]|nr:hypothetical protein ABI59_20780 [Acidobacteria bacterium Mor1]
MFEETRSNQSARILPLFAALLLAAMAGAIGTASADSAAEPFAVSVETTRGTFEVEVYPEWAPASAARFREMVDAGYLEGSPFHWVLEGSQTEFGLNPDASLTREWTERALEQDPPSRQVEKGYLHFMMELEAGLFPKPDGAIRPTRIGIEMGNGPFANGAGLAPFGRVVEGWEIVEGFDAGHMEKPAKARKMIKQLEKKGYKSITKKYPDLDRIERIVVLDRTVDMPSAPLRETPADLADGMARVRIYRPGEQDQVFKLSIDGVKRAKLKSGTYFEVDLPAGSHQLSAKVRFKFGATGLLDKAMAAKQFFPLELEAGTVTYVRAWSSFFEKQKLAFNLVAPEFGAEDSAGMEPAELLSEDDE